MLREGNGEPLVLLHGLTCTAEIWEDVMPALAPHYDTIALTALGHRDGPVPARRPVRMEHMVDTAEAQLDALGLERPHLAGFSMGGFMALELARRGRARTVCALSPTGAWEEGGGAVQETRQGLRDMARDAKRGRPLLPLVARSKRLRKFALALNANHGERLSAKQMIARTDDVLGCTVIEDLLDTDEALAPLDPPPCPITIAWSDGDRVLPLRSNGELAKQLVPGAHFLVLEDVGHTAMFDDPGLVASTIREACG